MGRGVCEMRWCLFMLAVLGLVHGFGCAATGAGEGSARVAADSAGEPLRWLAGSWRCVNEAGTWDEHWYEPIDGTIAGSLRWTRADGTLALLELFSIQRVALEPGDPARAVLFLRHFHSGLEPWAAEREATPRYTIERADGDQLVALSFPDQLTMIRYQRRPDGGDGFSAEVLKRGDVQGEWSRRVFLAFERPQPR